MATAASKASIRSATDAELRKLGETATPYGRVAQRLATLLDEMRSPRDAAPVAREYRLVMEQIRSGAVLVADDPLDEIGKRRAARLGNTG